MPEAVSLQLIPNSTEIAIKKLGMPRTRRKVNPAQDFEERGRTTVIFSNKLQVFFSREREKK